MVPIRMPAVTMIGVIPRLYKRIKCLTRGDVVVQILRDYVVGSPQLVVEASWVS